MKIVIKSGILRKLQGVHHSCLIHCQKSIHTKFLPRYPKIEEIIRGADTPQFRGGNPYFFRENPYQSVSFIYASMYSENVHAIHTMPYQFTKKIATLQQRTKIGALGHMARQSD